MKEDKKYDHGFKVPSDYFDSLDDALNVRIMEEALPDKSGFKAPDNYFSSLEDTLWNRIAEEEGKNESAVIPLWPKRLGYAIAIAASLLLGWFLLNPSDSMTLEELPVAEVEQYIQNGNLDLEVYDIAQLLTENDMDDFSGGLQFEEGQLESYLMEHLDETTLLLD